MIVHLRNTASGLIKTAKAGFSWTTLFFGFFPALLRGDLKWAAIMFIIPFALNMVIGLPTVGAGLAISMPLSWIFWLYFSFTYNQLYIRQLLESGFVPADEHSRHVLMSQGLALPEQKDTTVRVPAGEGRQTASASTPKDPIDAATIETVILRAAKAHGGVITPAEVAVGGDYSLDESKACLDDLVSRGHAELRVRRSGGMVYVFPDLLTPEAEDLVEPLT